MDAVVCFTYWQVLCFCLFGLVLTLHGYLVGLPRKDRNSPIGYLVHTVLLTIIAAILIIFLSMSHSEYKGIGFAMLIMSIIGIIYSLWEIATS